MSHATKMQRIYSATVRFTECLAKNLAEHYFREGARRRGLAAFDSGESLTVLRTVSYIPSNGARYHTDHHELFQGPESVESWKPEPVENPPFADDDLPARLGLIVCITTDFGDPKKDWCGQDTYARARVRVRDDRLVVTPDQKGAHLQYMQFLREQVPALAPHQKSLPQLS